MSDPGWFPDPGAEPGRYRYWDGRTWSAHTVGDPATPAPGPVGAPGAGPPAGWRVPLVWLSALLVVALLAVVVVVHDRPAPAPTPTPSSTAAAPPDACTSGRPLDREPHPVGARVYGGGLSYRPPQDWRPAARATPFAWAWDVGETEATTGRTRSSLYAVGTLSTQSAASPRQAAELAMGCTVASRFYPGLIHRFDRTSWATQVDGHPAWTIHSALLVDETAPTTGTIVQITVVDLGSPDWLSFFWGTAPVGDAGLLAQLNQVTGQLRAE